MFILDFHNTSLLGVRRPSTGSASIALHCYSKQTLYMSRLYEQWRGQWRVEPPGSLGTAIYLSGGGALEGRRGCHSWLE